MTTTTTVDFHATMYCHYHQRLANLTKFNFRERQFLKQSQQYHLERWLALSESPAFSLFIPNLKTNNHD